MFSPHLISNRFPWRAAWIRTGTSIVPTLLATTSLVLHAAGAPSIPTPTSDTAPSSGSRMLNTRSQPVPLQSLGMLGTTSESVQADFSPTGERFARRNDKEIELWQTSPLKRLVRVGASNWTAIHQMLFSANGQLHYIDYDRHHWITPDLQQGTGIKMSLLSADGRHALRIAPQDGEDGFEPIYYGATSDVYDLQEKRSVCQFPHIDLLSGPVFANGWFAVQLASVGPRSPQPLAVCELATGRAVLMPFGGASRLYPTLDPQGRWLMVHASGTRFLGLSNWSERKVFALPLAQHAFSHNPDNQPYACVHLPCGNPDPSPMANQLPQFAPFMSPDGSWLVFRGSESLQIFRNPHMAQVAKLPHAAFKDPSADAKTGHYRIVFSANSRFMGLQVNNHLYRLDLQGQPLQLQEMAPPVADFNLQAISSDGLHWLVQHKTGPQQTFQGALWRGNP